MEYALLLVITVGSKEFMIGRARSDDTLTRSNKASASIDRQRQGDWDILLDSLMSCNEMRRVRYGRNSKDGISVNPPITIRSIILHITGHGNSNLVNTIRGKSDSHDRSSLWHGVAINESENCEGDRI